MAMKKIAQRENGSAILFAVLTLVIVSVIAAGVLYNCTTRYNISSKHVKAWNEALYAAEAGGDVAFAEIRKMVGSGSTFATTFTGDGWSVASAPTPGPAYKKTAITLGQNSSQSATVTVDSFTTINSFPCYRIRSVGTATLFGVRRMGMDDRLLGQADTTAHFANGSATRGSGDSLLRKIDFNYDHYLATYGDGDGNGATLQTVSSPQVARRIETIAVPQWSFTGPLTVTNSFNGPGAAGVVDSYDSKNGAYTFVANNPSSPLYSYSQEGDVSVATSSFSEGGPIYGDVTTNGGNVTHANSNISGTIDNSVPFTIPPLPKPAYPSGYVTGSGSSINPPQAIGTTGSPNFYVYSGGTNLTINAYKSGGKTYETHVTVVVNGDLGHVSIDKGVIAQIYFTGNFSGKAGDLTNNNVDGTWSGVYQADGITTSTQVSRAGALQLYGVSPTDGSYQSINIAPPGNVWATVYAPNANITLTGNPDWYGAIVCHDFSGNGNTGFHYDMEIVNSGIPIDYQLASYIEDIR
jgi:hypothetical protein